MVLVPDRAGEHAHAAAVALRRIGRGGFGCIILNHIISEIPPYLCPFPKGRGFRNKGNIFFSKRQKIILAEAQSSQRKANTCSRLRQIYKDIDFTLRPLRALRETPLSPGLSGLGSSENHIPVQHHGRVNFPLHGKMFIHHGVTERPADVALHHAAEAIIAGAHVHTDVVDLVLE